MLPRILYQRGRNIGPGGYGLISARLSTDGREIEFAVFNPRHLTELIRAIDLNTCASMAGLAGAGASPEQIAEELCARLTVKGSIVTFLAGPCGGGHAAECGGRWPTTCKETVSDYLTICRSPFLHLWCASNGKWLRGARR